MTGMRRCLYTHTPFLSHLYEAVDDWHAQVLEERKLDELNSARFRDELKQALAQPLNNNTELKKRGVDLEKERPAAVHQVQQRAQFTCFTGTKAQILTLQRACTHTANHPLQAELRVKQLELQVMQLEHDRAVAPVAHVQSDAGKALEFEVKPLEHDCIDSPQLHAAAWSLPLLFSLSLFFLVCTLAHIFFPSSSCKDEKKKEQLLLMNARLLLKLLRP